jgi:Predicted acetyltransferase
MFFDTNNLKSDEIFLKLERTEKANPEKGLAASYHFKICLVLDGTEIGHCDFRVGHGEKLYLGGNIAYTVYEPYRGHHYAGKACLLLFNLARKHGMDYFHITCNPENYASRKTCEYVGGVLGNIVDLPSDNDMYIEGERQKCIYRFDLIPQTNPQ